MKAGELTDKIIQLLKGDNLEVKVESRISMGDHEENNDIIIERVVTPDYIRITRIYKHIPRDRSSGYSKVVQKRSENESKHNRQS